jgi:threonine/homoserine/homoserine lactone efflux protein
VRGLRLAGGLFLLYLAWGVLHSLRSLRATSAAPAAAGGAGEVSPRQTIWQAALMNVLSPGPWIFWSTVAGPAFLQGWRRSPLEGGSFLVSFYAAMVAVLLGLIALFAALGRADARAVRILHGLSGLLLAGFGVYQILGI